MSARSLLPERMIPLGPGRWVRVRAEERDGAIIVWLEQGDDSRGVGSVIELPSSSVRDVGMHLLGVAVTLGLR